MKQILSILLCLTLALTLCACGETPAAESEKPANMQSSLPTTSAAAPEEDAEPSPEIDAAAQEAVKTARKLKDHPVSELIEALGEPLSEDAAPSCMGPGEDVNLYYDGFTVYTYKEGDSQTVVDAELSK